MTDSDSLFEQVGGTLRFRGLPVERRTVRAGGHVYELDGLRDAADLLDHPDFARRFIEQDLAPYGVELWPGATMLADYLTGDTPGDDRSTIELGCGLGLVAMAATRLGWEVLATDNDEIALRFARHNADLNRVTVAALETLDWSHPPPGRRFARVLGADLLYQLSNHEPILHCTAALLAPNGAALFADPNRSVADRFGDLAREAGFRTEVLPVTATNRLGRTVDGRIFRLRRK